jgi:hypothetical protein
MIHLRDERHDGQQFDEKCCSILSLALAVVVWEDLKFAESRTVSIVRGARGAMSKYWKAVGRTSDYCT